MADYEYLTESGVVVADTADLQSDVVSEWQSAFGSDLVTTAETPQGVMITAEVEARDAVVRNNAALANQINPNIAGGIFLDAICALSGGKRAAATYSTVKLVALVGVASTLIPAGSQATSEAGDTFALDTAVVLDDTGNGVGNFTAILPGPIAVAPHALNSIATSVLGWEGIDNDNAASVGSNEQSDASLRLERTQTLALQGQSTPEAIISGVRGLDGVRSLAFRENITGATAVIDGITLVEHSIWLCVDGGTDAEVAAMILEKKSGGADMNGAVEVDVVEPSSGQTYPVKFDRPDPVGILVRATIRTGSILSDLIGATKSYILAYVNGEIDGEVGFAVGEDVSPFELAGAVNIGMASIYVIKMEVAYDTGSPTYVTTTLDIALNEIATTSEAGIQVVVV